MRIKFKFIFHLTLFTFLVFGAIYGFLAYKYYQQSKFYLLKITNLYADKLALKVQTKLNEYMTIVSNTKTIFEYHAEKDKNLNDNFVKPILVALLKQNPDFLASWLSVEMSFLDKNWYQASGRRRIIAFWEKGQIHYNIDTLDVDKENPASDYYKMKIGLYKKVITDPYFFTYSYQDTISSYIETSLGESLFYGDKFIGIVGIDVQLSKLKSLISISTPFKNSYTFLVSTSGKIVAHPDSKNLAKKITLVYPQLKNSNVYDSISQAKSFYRIIKYNHGKQYLFKFSPIVVADPKLPWSLVYVVPYDEILANVRRNILYAVLVPILALILFMMILSVFVNSLNRKIQKSYYVLDRLSKGDIDEKYKLKLSGKDEFAFMSKKINQLIDHLLEALQFAQEIGKGNLDVYYELKGDNDILGKTLIEMKKNLKQLREQEQKRIEESKKISWIQNGITEINEILRKYNDNLDSLTFEVVRFIVKYTEAAQGAIYLVTEKEGKKIIKLQVAYAYDRKKQLEAEFEIGEGLIGRAIKEKTVIKIPNLPQGYVYVKSGLGGETPNHLIILPLIFEEEVLGAIEVLSFKEFEESKEEFLTQASSRIASTVANILKTLQTIKLLEQFKNQSKFIEEKEKNIERRLQQLDQMQQEVQVLKQKYEKFFENIGLVLSVIHYNENFIITRVNQYLLSALQIEPYQILGKHISEILPEAKNNPQWFERFIEDLKKGFVRKKQTQYTIGKKILFVDEVYIPIKDPNDKVIEILVLGYDITKYKNLQQKK